MEEIFGKDIMEAFQKKRPAGFVDLMIAFESRKRGCSPNKLTPLNIALPFSFIDFYRRHKGKDVILSICLSTVYYDEFPSRSAWLSTDMVTKASNGSAMAC